MFWIIIFIIIADFALGTYLDKKNQEYANHPIPDELKGVYDDNEYKKQQNYFVANNKFGNIIGLYSLVLILLMFFCNGFAFVDNIARSLFDQSEVLGRILTGLCFFGILYIVNDILETPFSYYKTFTIEEKFGFNKTSQKTFFMDIIKGWALTAIFGSILLGLLMLAYEYTNQYFGLIGWCIITLFSIFSIMFYSSVIVPLFNKQTPLEQGELRTAIEDFCDKVGFKIDNLYVMDSSKRSTKANAYFSGLGAKKRIVLFDTLISTLSTQEIVAVLAHEIGHYKKKHTKKMLVFNILYFAIVFWLLSYFLENKDMVANILGCEQGSFWTSLIVFGILFTPVSTITSLLINIQSRKNEYEADEFAKKNGQATFLISSLKKLSSSSLSNLTPHPYYVFFHYSHPTLYQRMKALE